MCPRTGKTYQKCNLQVNKPFVICSLERTGESAPWIPHRSIHRTVVDGQQLNDGILKYIENQFDLLPFKRDF